MPDWREARNSLFALRFFSLELSSIFSRLFLRSCWVFFGVCIHVVFFCRAMQALFVCPAFVHLSTHTRTLKRVLSPPLLGGLGREPQARKSQDLGGAPAGAGHTYAGQAARVPLAQSIPSRGNLKPITPHALIRGQCFRSLWGCGSVILH